jgi:two-component system phosphate regulon sensor histidine kinase PhoR
MFTSIRLRIATAFVILIVTTIGALSLYLVHFVQDNYLTGLEKQLSDQAYLISDASESYLLTGGPEDIRELVERLGKKVGTRITIIDLEGDVLGDSDEDPATMENHSNRPEVIGALAGGVTMSIRYSITLNCNMMYVAVPIATDDLMLGVCRVALPLTSIQGALRHINHAIGGGAVIAILITIIVSAFVSTAITRPLRRVTYMARQLAEGDLDQTVQVRSRDELSDLARAFNKMSAKLKEMMGLLRDEHDRMSAIIENAADGVLVVNTRGEVSMVNRAAAIILDIDEKVAMGRPFIELVRDHEITDVLYKCLDTGKPQKGLIETEPGEKLLGVIATPLGEDIGGIVLLQDLTELHRLERIRSDFIANIYHELSTPLTSLKLLTETLQAEGMVEDSTAIGFVKKIDTELDRLVQMVKELGELSSIETGSETLELAPVDVTELISQVASRLAAQLKRAYINLELAFSPGLPRVRVDSRRVEQVLVNLLHNAIKFTPAGGNIKIIAKVENEELCISVVDTGVGIPQTELSRIFERFYKVDRARSSTGSGLGLAIVKHIVEAHGGRVWVESKEGKGSSFTFCLPLVPVEH